MGSRQSPHNGVPAALPAWHPCLTRHRCPCALGPPAEVETETRVVKQLAQGGPAARKPRHVWRLAPSHGETVPALRKPVPSMFREFIYLFMKVEVVIYESGSRLVVSDSLQPHGLYSPWDSPGQDAGMGSHSVLQGMFPTQGLNPGLPHCRRILYQLSHK